MFSSLHLRSVYHLSVQRTVYLPAYPSVYLPVAYSFPSVCLSLCLSLKSTFCLSSHLLLEVSIYRTIYLSTFQPIYQSMYLSLYPSICLLLYTPVGLLQLDTTTFLQGGFLSEKFVRVSWAAVPWAHQNLRVRHLSHCQRAVAERCSARWVCPRLSGWETACKQDILCLQPQASQRQKIARSRFHEGLLDQGGQTSGPPAGTQWYVRSHRPASLLKASDLTIDAHAHAQLPRHPALCRLPEKIKSHFLVAAAPGSPLCSQNWSPVGCMFCSVPRLSPCGFKPKPCRSCLCVSAVSVCLFAGLSSCMRLTESCFCDAMEARKWSNRFSRD